MAGRNDVRQTGWQTDRMADRKDVSITELEKTGLQFDRIIDTQSDICIQRFLYKVTDGSQDDSLTELPIDVRTTIRKSYIV